MLRCWKSEERLVGSRKENVPFSRYLVSQPFCMCKCEAHLTKFLSMCNLWVLRSCGHMYSNLCCMWRKPKPNIKSHDLRPGDVHSHWHHSHDCLLRKAIRALWRVTIDNSKERRIAQMLWSTFFQPRLTFKSPWFWHGLVTQLYSFVPVDTVETLRWKAAGRQLGMHDIVRPVFLQSLYQCNVISCVWVPWSCPNMA